MSTLSGSNRRKRRDESPASFKIVCKKKKKTSNAFFDFKFFFFFCFVCSWCRISVVDSSFERPISIKTCVGFKTYSGKIELLPARNTLKYYSAISPSPLQKKNHIYFKKKKKMICSFPQKRWKKKPGKKGWFWKPTIFINHKSLNDLKGCVFTIHQTKKKEKKCPVTP